MNSLSTGQRQFLVVCAIAFAAYAVSTAVDRKVRADSNSGRTAFRAFSAACDGSKITYQVRANGKLGAYFEASCAPHIIPGVTTP